jgi:hypothetical protein
MNNREFFTRKIYLRLSSNFYLLTKSFIFNIIFTHRFIKRLTKSYSKKLQSLKIWDTPKNWLKVNTIDATIPEFEGKAYVTGKHQFIRDPDDPNKNGFILR